MNKAEAYKIVYDDLMNCGCSLFRGIYDAKNGNKIFMHGISTVISFIADKIDFDTSCDFDNLFIENMINSETKVGLRRENL